MPHEMRARFWKEMGRMKVIEQFRPARMYGLSATPFREDKRSVDLIFGQNTKYFENKSMKPVVEVVKTNEKIQTKRI